MSAVMQGLVAILRAVCVMVCLMYVGSKVPGWLWPREPGNDT